MSIRLAKQLIYGAFYVVVWVLIFWGGYTIFFRPAPLPPSSPALAAQPITLLGGPYLFTVSPGHDTFLAQIENPNADLAAQYFAFSFDLRNASGTVEQSFPGASFLYPNQVKYVVLVNQAVNEGNADGAVAPYNGSVTGTAMDVATTTATITLATGWTLDVPTSTVQWAASSSFGAPPALIVQNISTRIVSSTALATGELTNNDTAAFNNIFIVAVFKDASGNPIGASQTELDSIAPNTSEAFSVSYPILPGINPAATEVEAYVGRG